MALIATSIKINASPEKIFSYVSSLDSLKNEYVVSVEADGPVKLGAKIKTKYVESVPEGADAERVIAAARDRAG